MGNDLFGVQSRDIPPRMDTSVWLDSVLQSSDHAMATDAAMDEGLMKLLRARIPADVFDREKNVARLRAGEEPKWKFEFNDSKPFFSLRVSWDVHFDGKEFNAKQDVYRLRVLLNRNLDPGYYIVLFTYDRRTGVISEAEDSVRFENEPRPSGLLKALRLLALQGVPRVKVRIHNPETLGLLGQMAGEGNSTFGLAHSQVAIALVGRTTPDEFLWSDHKRTGRFCLNFSQFGAPDAADRIQRIFGEARDVELAYYDGPVDIHLADTRRSQLRARYPDRSAVEALADKFQQEARLRQIAAQSSLLRAGGANTGGIDLTRAKEGLRVRSEGQGVEFKFDPAMIQRLQNASGLTPVIIDIRPMTTTVPLFLGLEDGGVDRVAAVRI